MAVRETRSARRLYLHMDFPRGNRVVCRILIVEDDPRRADLLCSWFPKGFRGVAVRSAGTAIGVLERTEPLDFAAVMLDHDLQLRPATAEDLILSGSSITELIARKISREIPILVHSMNVTRGPIIASRLADAGFEVVQIPVDQLTPEWLGGWLREARENYEDLLAEA